MTEPTPHARDSWVALRAHGKFTVCRTGDGRIGGWPIMDHMFSLTPPNIWTEIHQRINERLGSGTVEETITDPDLDQTIHDGWNT